MVITRKTKIKLRESCDTENEAHESERKQKVKRRKSIYQYIYIKERYWVENEKPLKQKDQNKKVGWKKKEGGKEEEEKKNRY